MYHLAASIFWHCERLWCDVSLLAALTIALTLRLQLFRSTRIILHITKILKNLFYCVLRKTAIWYYSHYWKFFQLSMVISDDHAFQVRLHPISFFKLGIDDLDDILLSFSDVKNIESITTKLDTLISVAFFLQIPALSIVYAPVYLKMFWQCFLNLLVPTASMVHTVDFESVIFLSCKKTVHHSLILKTTVCVLLNNRYEYYLLI